MSKLEFILIERFDDKRNNHVKVEITEALINDLDTEVRNILFNSFIIDMYKKIVDMRNQDDDIPGPIKETFFERMKREMWLNGHKGDWKEFAVKENRPEILREIEHHYSKLVLAFEKGDEELIKEHSADIGNIAMFMYESTNN